MRQRSCPQPLFVIIIVDISDLHISFRPHADVCSHRHPIRETSTDQCFGRQATNKAADEIITNHKPKKKCHENHTSISLGLVCMCLCVRWLHLCVCVFEREKYLSSFTLPFNSFSACHFVCISFSWLPNYVQTSRYYLPENDYVIHSESYCSAFLLLIALPVGQYICQFIWLFLYFDRIEIVAKAALSVSVYARTRSYAEYFHLLSLLYPVL